MQAIWGLTLSGQMEKHLWISALEFALGYAIASVIGIGIGFGMANSPRFKQAMQPWVSGLYATPTVALAPLFILWFGIGEVPAVFTAFLISFFPIVVNVATGLATIEPELEDVLKALGAKLVLTEPNGKAHEYHPGDSLVLPANYTGTWEMVGNYREIAVVAAKRR